MEDIFIQKLFQLTEQVLKQDAPYKQLIVELETHLKKARQMKFHRHEAETLSSLGLAHSYIWEIDTSLNYFQLSLEKAETYQYTDLICKLCNNISKLLQSIGDIEQAMIYANKGIAVVESQNINKLSSLYLYASKAYLLLLWEQYAEANTAIEKAWELSNHVDIKNYSQLAFARVIYYLHLSRLYIYIYKRDDKQYHETLKMVLSLRDQVKSYEEIFVLVQLLHAIVITQDENKMHDYEQKVINYHNGTIPLVELKNLTIFLTHNQSHTWAKKYAQQILEQAQNNPQANAKMIEHAQHILAGTFS